MSFREESCTCGDADQTAEQRRWYDRQGRWAGGTGPHLKHEAIRQGPVGIVALLLALNIFAIVAMAYLTTTTEHGAVMVVVGFLCATAMQLVLTIRSLLS